MQRTLRLVFLLLAIAVAGTLLLLGGASALAQTQTPKDALTASTCVANSQEVGVWLTATVDNSADVGAMLTMAASPTGTLFIAYYDATNADLKLAQGYTDSWHISTVDNDGYTGAFPSLDLDQFNQPHISYASFYTDTYASFFVKALNYAYQDDTGWQAVELDPLPPPTSDGIGYHSGPTSLRLAAGDVPHIIYMRSYYGPPRSGSLIQHATPAGGIWQYEYVSSGSLSTGDSLSLELDQNATPRAAYLDSGYYTSPTLVVARRAAPEWEDEVVDSGTYYNDPAIIPDHPSLVLDGAGRLQMSYNKGGDLYFARRESTGWLTDTVDSASAVYMATALAVDACNHPIVAYSDAEYGDRVGIKIALWDGFQWHLEAVEVVAGAGNGLSIAIAGSTPILAYYHEPSRSLRVAWRSTLRLAPVAYLPLVMDSQP